MYDLAISEHGDLILGANRDLAGVVGIGVTSQRIVIRLRTPRGQWTHDASGSFGSELRVLLRDNSPNTQARAENYILEALSPMSDISVENVEVNRKGRNSEITVHYSPIVSDTELATDEVDDVVLTASVTI